MTTAAVLIKRAYALAQVLDPNEEIEGFQSNEGLEALNGIIEQWGSLSIYIPTYKIISVSVLAGTSEYTITPVITQLSEGHLIDQNNAQTPLRSIDLQEFNTLNFVLSALSPARPYLIFLKNDFANYPTQSKVVFYFVPDASYTATLYAMSRLADVAYSDTFTTVPNYGLKALRYELAKELSETYGTILPASFFDEYKLLMTELKAANRRDRSIQVRNEFITVRRYRPWGTYVG